MSTHYIHQSGYIYGPIDDIDWNNDQEYKDYLATIPRYPWRGEPLKEGEGLELKDVVIGYEAYTHGAGWIPTDSWAYDDIPELERRKVAYPVSAAAKGAPAEGKQGLPDSDKYELKVVVFTDKNETTEAAIAATIINSLESKFNVIITPQPPAKHTGSGQRLFTEKEVVDFNIYANKFGWYSRSDDRWYSSHKTNGKREEKTTSDLLNEYIKTLNK